MDDMVSASTRWSVYIGIYAFLAGVGLVVPLGAIADTLITVLGLPTGFTAILIPGTGALIAAVVWWILLERLEQYSYLRGGIAGVVTAFLTVVFWTFLVAILYGLGMMLVTGTVIGFVLVVVTPVAFIVWLPMVYARRHLASGHAGGIDPSL